MGKITIVTAFYSIHRENWDILQRTEKEYFIHFKYWARMKNNLVVYVENNAHKEEIEKIREEFGLSEQTKVIVTGEIEKIDGSLFEQMKTVMENYAQIDFHVKKKNPEAWNTKYNLIMILKGWFLLDAVKRGYVENDVAWLDFGFGHGDRTYVNPEEFSYEWKYDFPKKINMFYMKYPDGKPVFDLVRTGETYFSGGILIMNKEFVREFWELMRDCMNSLLAAGLCDDDQTIQYMAFMRKPDLFHIEESDWCTELKNYGGEHLTLAKAKVSGKRFPWLRSVIRKWRQKRQILNYVKRQYHYLSGGLE